MVDSVIPIFIQRKLVGAEEVFEVTASTDNGTVFNTEINLKEIRLKKTSECFVQWRNRKSKNAWGLNFISEEEAQKFVDFCTVARVRSWYTATSSVGSESTQATVKTNNSPSSKNNTNTPSVHINENVNNSPNTSSHLLHSTGDHYSSSSTLVATETASNSSSHGSLATHGKPSSHGSDSLTPHRKGSPSGSKSHSNGSSHSNGYSVNDSGYESISTSNKSNAHGPESLETVATATRGPDSGYGVEEEESDPSLPTSQPSNDNDQDWRLSLPNDSEQSVATGFSANADHYSGLGDSIEMSYYKQMAKFNAEDSVEISATFHENGDLMSSCSTDIDLKPKSGIAQSRQGGATRKAGWLSGKHVLTRGKGGKVDLASDRKWRKYWITLKSAALNFYHCNEKTVSAQDLDDSSFSLEIGGCVAQAVPEHAKLDHVFSVSTRLGEAYYFQAGNQTDLENWITAIHSMAASLLMGPGRKGKDETVQLLREKTDKVEEKIDSDSKLKKMAELQSTVVTEPKTKHQFVDQISRWEKNLEQLNVTMYRLQCYTSAVRGTPLPNPQTLLSRVSRTTKQVLSRLGTFSVMSFHAVVSARDPSIEEEVKARNKTKRSPSSVGYNRLKSAIFTSLRISDAATVNSIRDRYSPRNTPKGTPGFKRSNLDNIPDTLEEEGEAMSLSSSHSEWKNLGNYLRISLPSNQATVISLSNEMTVREAVENTCQKRQFEPRAYFLRLGIEESSGAIDFYTPKEDDLLEDQNYTNLKLCARCVYSVELTKSIEAGGLDFGISVSSSDGALYISKVEEGRLAHVQGVLSGDEILAVNDVDAVDVENPLEDLKAALEDPCITLKLRSPREEPPVANKVTSDAIISSLVIKPPPKLSDNIEEQDLSELIVPPPMMDFEDAETCSILTVESHATSMSDTNTEVSSKTVDELLQQAEQVTLFCRQQIEYSDDEFKPAVHLTDAQKLRKVILELVDTERSYVKDLKLLLKRYLDPLKDENFMSQAEVKALVSTVDEILAFQKIFLSEIERLIDSETGFDAFDKTTQFQNVIYTIGETFLQYTEHFKLYSAFCSSHSRVVELLGPGKNEALRMFLDARNPKNQHSGTLESYFIKPIQRILRYPLLLRTILKLLDDESEEYQVLLEAVVAIEKVAKHINEMQRITEKFAPMFNQLVEEYEACEVSDVTIDRLLRHGKVTWLNCPDEPRSGTIKMRYPVSPRLGKKITRSVMHLFVFEKVVILVNLETKARKKEKITSVKSSEEVKFKTLIPVTSLVIRDHCWATDETLHSWELVNISDTTELGRQECTYLFASKTPSEKREVVRSIKEAIKRGIKAGSSASTKRSHSFRRADTTRLNASDPGPGNFLRCSPADSGLLRRSFSHNPEEAQHRRTSLVESEQK